MKCTSMRKMLSTIVLAIFMSQSLLTSYLYAAEPAPVPTKPAEQSNQSANQQLVDGFLKMDLSTVSPIMVLQVAAYLYVYDKNGIAGFDFEKGDASQAMMTINYFLSAYAPNV